MRGVAGIMLAGLAALVAGGAASATSAPRPILAQPVGSPTAAQGAQSSASKPTATLSSRRAGARAVVVGLQFETAYVCGQPRGVVVTLPKGETMPAKLERAAVKVNGKPAPGVTVSGRAVTVKASTGGGVTCDSIRLGNEVLTFTAAAGLGNPKAPGRYSIGLRQGTAITSAAVTIT